MLRQFLGLAQRLGQARGPSAAARGPKIDRRGGEGLKIVL